MAVGGESASSAAMIGPLVSAAVGAEPQNNTLDKVIRSTGMPLELAAPFLVLIGASGNEHLKVLGTLSQDEIADEIKTLQIDGKPLDVMQKGFIQALIHECRIIGGSKQPDLGDDAASHAWEPVHANTGEVTSKLSGPRSCSNRSSCKGQKKVCRS